MNPIILPAIWLIVLIVGLPQLSETVYTPSLPDIAKDLGASVSSVEHTLTIYLFGFAIGTLFWGKISDKFGRKPCVILGLIIFIIGCIGCFFSESIEALMISRLIQAFGGSIGSVLGQAICRDAFSGPALGKVYSAIGSALALFPALGPLCGGLIAENFGWNNIFIFLVIFALILTILVAFKLPETHPRASRQKISIWDLAKKLMLDRRVMGFGIIVAGSNGILFSYFAEGAFFLINGLKLSPSAYGSSFILIAFSSMMGGITSKKLHKNYSSNEIMLFGLKTIAVATSIFSIVAITYHYVYDIPLHIMICVTIASQMFNSFGICIATSNALALALLDYKYAIGTASSLFGFFYYCLISLFTLLMGLLHNGALITMPLYFLVISCLMLIVNKIYLKN